MSNNFAINIESNRLLKEYLVRKKCDDNQQGNHTKNICVFITFSVVPDCFPNFTLCWTWVNQFRDFYYNCEINYPKDARSKCTRKNQCKCEFKYFFDKWKRNLATFGTPITLSYRFTIEQGKNWNKYAYCLPKHEKTSSDICTRHWSFLSNFFVGSVKAISLFSSGDICALYKTLQC